MIAEDEADEHEVYYSTSLLTVKNLIMMVTEIGYGNYC